MKQNDRMLAAVLICVLLLGGCTANQSMPSDQQGQPTEQASGDLAGESTEPVSNTHPDGETFGTGPQGNRDEAANWLWVPSAQQGEEWYQEQNDDETRGGIAYNTNVITITGLRSLSAQQKLNDLIAQHQQQLISELESQQEWQDALGHAAEASFEGYLSCYASVCCRGHYISVSFWGYASAWRSSSPYESFCSLDRTDSFVYDVDRQQVAELSDLFDQGSDYVPLLDQAVRQQLMEEDWWSWEDCLKRPFDTLQDIACSFSFTDYGSSTSLVITVPKENRYFDFGSDYSFQISFEELADVLACYGQDPGDILRTPTTRMLQCYDFSDATLTDMPGMEAIQPYGYEEGFQSLRLTGEAQIANEAVEALEQQVAAQFNYERLIWGYANVTVNYAQCGLSYVKRCGNLLVLSYSGYLDTNIGSFNREWYRLIDLQSGRALTLREVLNPWRMDEIKSQEGWNDLLLDSPDFLLQSDGTILLWILNGPNTGSDQSSYLTLRDCYNWD